MNIDSKKLEEAVEMAGSRTIAPYHFATVTGDTWDRAKAVLKRYSRNGAIKDVGHSRFRVPKMLSRAVKPWRLVLDY